MIFIITGKQGEGKTTVLKEIIETLQLQGLVLAGFFADGKWSNGQRSGFNLTDVQSGTTKALCQTIPLKGGVLLGRFYFDPSVIRWGEKLLEEGKNAGAELFVIDEMGKFELKGKVWSTIFMKLKEENAALLVTVRDSYMDEFIQTFKIASYYLHRVGESGEKLVEKILSIMK